MTLVGEKILEGVCGDAWRECGERLERMKPAFLAPRRADSSREAAGSSAAAPSRGVAVGGAERRPCAVAGELCLTDVSEKVVEGECARLWQTCEELMDKRSAQDVAQEAEAGHAATGEIAFQELTKQ